MALKHSMSVQACNGDTLPACAMDCLWFETDEDEGACLNRQNLICTKHQAEIFDTED